MNGNNAGGEAAHLGGAALGFVLIRNEYLLDWALPTRIRRGRKAVRTRKVKDWSKDFNR
jgi:hypothetical protein